MPVTRTSCIRALLADCQRGYLLEPDRRDLHQSAPEVLFLPADEFLRAVDAAQLQDIVAHGRLHQHGEIAPRGHRQHDLADAHAQDLFGARFERQAFQPGHNAAYRLFQLHDELEILAHAHGGFAEDRADVEHAQAPHFEEVFEQLGAAAFQRFGRDVVELDDVVGYQPAAARDELQRELALADTAFADQHDAHARARREIRHAA